MKWFHPFKIPRSWVARCLAMVFLFLVVMPSVGMADPGIPLKDKFKNQAGQTTVEFIEGDTNEVYYSEVKEGYKKEGLKDTTGVQIVLKPEDIKSSNESAIPLKTGIGERNESALVWEEEDQWFEWSVEIPEDGLYEFSMEYYPLPGTGSAVQRELVIDGEVPFVEAHNIPFYRMWTNEGAPKVNNIGDEVRPRQIEVPGWYEAKFYDNQGMYAEPFKVYLSKGSHSIRMNYINEPAAFGALTIQSPERLSSYKEIQALYQEKGYTEAKNTVKIQAEDAVIKTDPTVRQECSGDPQAEPAAKGNIKLNVFGDWRWRKGNHGVTWDFTVPEDGLYTINMRVGQWWGDGLPVHRQIAIDGKVPYEEMNEYAFSYKRDWRTETLESSDHTPYLFYLTKGKHQLTMTVKMGPLTDTVHDLNQDALLLSKVIRKIIMITGSEPDPNFQYELDKKIPDLISDLKKLSASMDKQVKQLTAISTKKPSVANNFIMIRQQLNEMIKKPDNISRKLNDLINAQSSIGSWLQDLQNQPMVIDYFVIGQSDKHWGKGASNVFQKVVATGQNFVRSFFKDYDSVGSVYTGDTPHKTTINVWMARGKDWVEIMKQMADEEFTPETGIQVNVNVLPGGQLNAGGVNTLLLSITSGKAPDVACGVDATSPVEFAIRDATVDLSRYKDFNEVSKRFLPGVMIPYQYNGGTYALPESMDFSVLFYRKDIISELGLTIPETWEEVYKNVLPALKQNGMDFFYPLGANGFLPFLYQYGGNYYHGQGKTSALDSPEAYMAFKEWTELYTNYRMPVQANFFNRMRTGEIPMGIEGYWQYVLLSTAAPELFGRWGIAPIPGHRKEDGTIDRTAGGLPQSTVILKQSKKQDESWEFLKWWTRDDTQARFGRELEALMGAEARWNTANINAFKELPWKRDDMKVITDQWQWYKEQPVVVGGYFSARHIYNGWNRVVLGEKKVRDSLEKSVKDINKELKAKQEEFGHR